VQICVYLLNIFSLCVYLLLLYSHTNVVKIFGAGFHHDRPFLVMERLDGGSLQYLLTEADECQCRIPLRKALQIARDLGNALQYLHSDFHPEAVLIHRDLKPDNIWYNSILF
jgi:serine/threonine protein kinase